MFNVSQAIMWYSQAWRETNPQIIRNNWRMSQILPTYWNANCAMDGERHKLRMKGVENELASLILFESWK